jgi:hypothetical protein
MLTDLVPWHNPVQETVSNVSPFPEILYRVLHRANSWTLEEVLVGSCLDEEDILRCHYELTRRLVYDL